MSDTTKPLSYRDANQTLKLAFNDIDASFTQAGFVVGQVGRKIERSVISATVDDYSYYEGATLLYTIRVTYSNAAHDEVNSVERTA